MASTTQVGSIRETVAPLTPIPIPVTPARDTLATGLHGAIGCDYIPVSNRLAFVEYDTGAVSVLNLIRSSTIVHQETTTLKGTWVLDLETGAQTGNLAEGDIWWDQQTTVNRSMAPVGGALIVNLGSVNYGALTAAGLQTLLYNNTPIPGNDNSSNRLTNGDVFAVLTNKAHYAKVQVLSYGYDIELQWVTYALTPAYQVLGTGYTNPECIAVQSDGIHAFVSERSGDIVAISLTAANRSSATAVASGLNAPQQIVLNAAQNVLYAVEFASPGRLLAIDVTSNAVRTITASLDQAVGVALSADGASAYVSEQSSAGGRVREVDLTTGAITTIATGFTAPFMMAYLDAADEQLALCEGNPANRIAVINLAAGNTVTRPAVTLASQPTSLAAIGGGDVLVTCTAEIDECALGLSATTGPLLKGIGFIPYDCISQTTGLATTAAGYFYQVTNAPFGGTLPIMLDHTQAWNDGAVYYSVLVNGVARSDSWNDYFWNETTASYVLTPTVPTTVAGHTVYPVRNPALVELWFNPDLGEEVPTMSYPDGIAKLQVLFYNATGGLVESSPIVPIQLANSPCSASVALAHIGGTYASPNCGVLDYAASTDVLTLSYTAAQPGLFATYAFSVQRGVNPASISQTGAVTNATMTQSPAVSALIGGCTLAGFAEYLSVMASATNGEGRQSQYDASASQAFVLAQS
jgi:hypothetical protein